MRRAALLTTAGEQVYLKCGGNAGMQPEPQGTLNRLSVSKLQTLLAVLVLS